MKMLKELDHYICIYAELVEVKRTRVICYFPVLTRYIRQRVDYVEDNMRQPMMKQAYHNCMYRELLAAGRTDTFMYFLRVSLYLRDRRDKIKTCYP